MSVGFTRRYTFDPGNTVITSIEGVVIIDRAAPISITGVGSDLALCVGEFEDGPFETVRELFGSDDLARTYGGFGFIYDSLESNHPCARARKADNAINPEYWNGNGFLSLVNKKFSRLIGVRVDTSVGSVLFTRQASISGSSNFNFDMEPGMTLRVKLNGAAQVSATFNATAATTDSAAGTYPSTFVGNESMTYIIDGVTYTTVFLAADQTQAQVVARLNLTVGYTAFAVVGGGVTSITGRQRGTGGNVQIVSVSGVLVTTATGFSAGAAVLGTGNVANIDQVTRAEVKTVVEAGVAGTYVDTDASGQIRISNAGTPGTGTIEFETPSSALLGAAATALGLVTAVVATAVTGIDGQIPAGTRVQTAGGVVFVTMQTIDITASNAGPYTVKVRHAVDDGTGLSQLVSTLTVLTGPIALGAFSVTNTSPILAALTEAQIDVKYLAAIDKTRSTSNVSKQVGIIWSARQSNAIRSKLRQNALDASANGCYGRMTVVRPPLNTTRANAKSSTAQPGVGTYRKERLIYAYPGIAHYVPQIATRGLAGGAGFTADGIIDAGFDSYIVSVLTQLPPENNPGELTSFMDSILSIERGNADVQDLTMEDYISFKASGIAAPRIDDGDVCIQSGCTSVDPLAAPNQKNINRRRMADFIQDSLTVVVKPFVKKLATAQARGEMLGSIGGFMAGLRPARIFDFSLDGKEGNTDATLALGIFRVKVKAKTIASMDDIVLDTEVGETVVITEAAA